MQIVATRVVDKASTYGASVGYWRCGRDGDVTCHSVKAGGEGWGREGGL